MLSVIAILGSLGGIVAMIGLLGMIIRGIFHQVNATEDNTEAVKKLNDLVTRLIARVEALERSVAIIEDRMKRHGNT